MIFKKKLQEHERAILDLHDKGKAMTEVGQAVGLGRERVRQIYVKLRNEPYGDYRRELAKRRKEEWAKEIAFVCPYCKTPITNEGRKGRSRYCSGFCREKYTNVRRDKSTLLICVGCDKAFHPYYNWEAVGSKSHYCDIKCYQKSEMFWKRDINCEVCGRLVKKARGGRKYCEECAKEVTKQRVNTRHRERYHSDPVYREKCLAYRRERYRKKKEKEKTITRRVLKSLREGFK